MELLDLREPVSCLSHMLGLSLAVPGTVWLWHRGRGDRTRQASLLVFGLGLIFCYSASSAYHGARGSDGLIDALRRLDHIGIFLLIAATYTPIAWTLLSGLWRRGTLLFAWGAAAGGVALYLGAGVLSPQVATALYLGMGWGAILFYLEVARSVTHRALLPILVGGILYSTGAAINLAHWPRVWPGVVGPHEAFHGFVLAGSLAHFRFMVTVVARSPVAVTPLGTVGPFLPSLRGSGRRSRGAVAFASVAPVSLSRGGSSRRDGAGRMAEDRGQATEPRGASRLA